MERMSTAWNILRYITSPVTYVLSVILYLLAIITAPLIHLGHYLIYGLFVYPINLLAKFETLYVFFGVAVLVGSIVGLSLYYTSVYITSMLSLDGQSEETRGRTISSYRADKAERWRQREPSLPLHQQVELPMDEAALKPDYMDWKREKRDRGSNGSRFVPKTILEEDDSSEDDF